MSLVNLGLLSGVFQIAWLLIALVVVAFLLRAYLRTRMSGLVWLLVAVFVWPLLTRLTPFLLPMWIASHAYGLNDAAMLNIVLFGIEGLIGAILLLVAVVLLDRQLTANRTSAEAAALPTYPSLPR